MLSSTDVAKQLLQLPQRAAVHPAQRCSHFPTAGVASAGWCVLVYFRLALRC